MKSLNRLDILFYFHEVNILMQSYCYKETRWQCPNEFKMVKSLRNGQFLIWHSLCTISIVLKIIRLMFCPRSWTWIMGRGWNLTEHILSVPGCLIQYASHAVTLSVYTLYKNYCVKPCMCVPVHDYDLLKRTMSVHVIRFRIRGKQYGGWRGIILLWKM